MKPKHQEIVKRLEENHQGLIQNAIDGGETQIRIGGEIFEILKEGDAFKLIFFGKDEDSIFNIKS